MSTSLDTLPPGTAITTGCNACGGPLEPIAELPGLPLTALFEPRSPSRCGEGFDQTLLFCPRCGHGQLAARLPADMLYDQTYGFRTSASGTARRGTDWFLRAVAALAPGRRFRCALDVGCNDFYLLRQAADRAGRRVGLDPLWAHTRPETGDAGIEVIGAAVEEADLAALGERPDLIVCRHTLEHISEPRGVLSRLLDLVADDGILVFEVPGFDALIERMRFDQVFHQHYQYWSLASLTRLIDASGGRYLTHRVNYHDWGAMLVAFCRGKDERPAASPPRPDDVRRRWELFRRHVAVAADTLAMQPEPVYGYGAAQMLPVLAYHLGTDLGRLRAVLDDDPAKDGWWYANLPLRIQPASIVEDWPAASVLLTAVDNAAPILTRLMSERPRHIIVPVPVI